MVADMSVGVGGMSDIRDALRRGNSLKKENNKILEDLLKIKKIEVTDKKPEVMFLFELLDFLKTIPQWIPNIDGTTYDQAIKKPRACFVGEKWNGKIEAYRDCENLCDFKAIEGEAIYFDVNYYIKKLEESLNILLEE